MVPFRDLASQSQMRWTSGLTVYSGATVLESHQIPLSIDYRCIVGYASGARRHCGEDVPLRTGDRTCRTGGHPIG